MGRGQRGLDFVTRKDGTSLVSPSAPLPGEGHSWTSTEVGRAVPGLIDGRCVHSPGRRPMQSRGRGRLEVGPGQPPQKGLWLVAHRRGTVTSVVICWACLLSAAPNAAARPHTLCLTCDDPSAGKTLPPWHGSGPLPALLHLERLSSMSPQGDHEEGGR